MSQPYFNLVLAKTYLAATDPKLVTRTSADVMERFCSKANPATKMRHERVVRTKPMLFLRDKCLVETTGDDIFCAIKIGHPSTIPFLQTLHRDALLMNWIPAPILAPRLWPKKTKRERRAVTLAEHKALVAAVADSEWGPYLELLWFTGASQTDAANLSVEKNIDWTNRALSYRRRKLEGRKLELPAASLGIGKGLEEVLRKLPKEGTLFPKISSMDDRSRACFFWKLCSI